MNPAKKDALMLNESVRMLIEDVDKLDSLVLTRMGTLSKRLSPDFTHYKHAHDSLVDARKALLDARLALILEESKP